MGKEIILKQFLDVDYIRDLVRKKYPNCQVQMVESCCFNFSDLDYTTLGMSVFSGKFIYVGYLNSANSRVAVGAEFNKSFLGTLVCDNVILKCNGSSFVPVNGSMSPVCFDSVYCPTGSLFSFSFIGFRVYVEGSIDNFILPYGVVGGDPLTSYSGYYYNFGDNLIVYLKSLGGVKHAICFVDRFQVGNYNVTPSGTKIVCPNAKSFGIGYLNGVVLASEFLNYVDVVRQVYFGSDHFSFLLDGFVFTGLTVTLGNKVVVLADGDSRFISCTYAEYGNTNLDAANLMSDFVIGLSGNVLVDGVSTAVGLMGLDSFVLHKL